MKSGHKHAAAQKAVLPGLLRSARCCSWQPEALRLFVSTRFGGRADCPPALLPRRLPGRLLPSLWSKVSPWGLLAFSSGRCRTLGSASALSRPGLVGRDGAVGLGLAPRRGQFPGSGRACAARGLLLPALSPAVIANAHPFRALDSWAQGSPTVRTDFVQFPFFFTTLLYFRVPSSVFGLSVFLTHCKRRPTHPP